MTFVSPAESAGRRGDIGSRLWSLARLWVLPVLALAPVLAWALMRAPDVSVEQLSPPAVSTLLAVPTFAPIYFGAGTTDIRPSQKKVLDGHALWLRSDGTRRLLVEGHTDGPAAHLRSVEIGEERARAAKAYLITKGADADHIAFVSRGGGQPSCTEKTAACRADNRRVTFSTRRH
jgi:outer membrane protein OmpA-like peptidoglycan-associated protein